MRHGRGARPGELSLCCIGNGQKRVKQVEMVTRIAPSTSAWKKTGDLTMPNHLNFIIIDFAAF